MRILAALLVSLLVLATPAWADHRQAETERLVRWAGCAATVHTSDQVSVLGSFYDGELWIGTRRDVPDYVWLMVTLHETGHCLQDQEGWFADPGTYYRDPVRFELDADRRSADLACGLGLDGRGLLHSLWVWALQRFGYAGDENHGTLAQRIHAGDQASRCHAPGPQAPFVRLP